MQRSGVSHQSEAEGRPERLKEAAGDGRSVGRNLVAREQGKGRPPSETAAALVGRGGGRGGQEVGASGGGPLLTWAARLPRDGGGAGAGAWGWQPLAGAKTADGCAACGRGRRSCWREWVRAGGEVHTKPAREATASVRKREAGGGCEGVGGAGRRGGGMSAPRVPLRGWGVSRLSWWGCPYREAQSPRGTLKRSSPSRNSSETGCRRACWGGLMGRGWGVRGALLQRSNTGTTGTTDSIGATLPGRNGWTEGMVMGGGGGGCWTALRRWR